MGCENPCNEVLLLSDPQFLIAWFNFSVEYVHRKHVKRMRHSGVNNMCEFSMKNQHRHHQNVFLQTINIIFSGP